MGERGKSLLLAVGMGRPKDEADGGDGDEEEYSPSDGELAAAEKLCRLLGVSEDKASKVCAAICDLIDSRGE